jgi:hypothetical protein
MAVDPPNGRRRSCQSTLLIKARLLLVLIRRMTGESFSTFRSLDRSAVERFQAFLQYRRDPRPGKTSPTTVAAHLLIFKGLYRQHSKLPDALVRSVDNLRVGPPLIARVTVAGQSVTAARLALEERVALWNAVSDEVRKLRIVPA